MIIKRNLFQNVSFSFYNTWRNYSVHREARFLRKILQKGQKKSLQYNHPPKMISMNDYARNVLFSEGTKRTEVLNKVFMEHICDVTSTGEYSTEMNNMGIQIVKVKISTNYHIIFVYWIHTNQIDEEKANDLLVKVAGHLRFELSTAKIMGVIPEIRFIKHEQLMEQEIINKILNDLTSVRETENILLDQSKEETEDENHNLVKTNDIYDFDLILSNIKANVYGLDRNKIIENIIHTKKNSVQQRKERISHITADKDGNLKFDKKILSKALFRHHFDEKKQKKFNDQLLNRIDSDYVEEENCFFDDENYVEYDENCVEVELNEMQVDDDIYENEYSQPEKTN